MILTWLLDTSRLFLSLSNRLISYLSTAIHNSDCHNMCSDTHISKKFFNFDVLNVLSITYHCLSVLISAMTRIVYKYKCRLFLTFLKCLRRLLCVPLKHTKFFFNLPSTFINQFHDVVVIEFNTGFFL